MNQPDDRSCHRLLKASLILILPVAFSPATIGEAFADAKSKTTQKDDTMTQTNATQRGSAQENGKNAIRPFHVNVHEAELTELRQRIKATRFPEKETVDDQ